MDFIEAKFVARACSSGVPPVDHVQLRGICEKLESAFPTFIWVVDENPPTGGESIKVYDPKRPVRFENGLWFTERGKEFLKAKEGVYQAYRSYMAGLPFKLGYEFQVDLIWVNSQQADLPYQITFEGQAKDAVGFNYLTRSNQDFVISIINGMIAEIDGKDLSEFFDEKLLSIGFGWPATQEFEYI